MKRNRNKNKNKNVNNNIVLYRICHKVSIKLIIEMRS